MVFTFRGIVITQLACLPSQEKHYAKKVRNKIKVRREGTLNFEVWCCATKLLAVSGACADSSWHKPQRKQIIECPKCKRHQRIEAGGEGGLVTRCPETKELLQQEITLD